MLLQLRQTCKNAVFHQPFADTLWGQFILTWESLLIKVRIHCCTFPAVVVLYVKAVVASDVGIQTGEMVVTSYSSTRYSAQVSCLPVYSIIVSFILIITTRAVLNILFVTALTVTVLLFRQLIPAKVRPP